MKRFMEWLQIQAKKLPSELRSQWLAFFAILALLMNLGLNEARIFVAENQIKALESSNDDLRFAFAHAVLRAHEAESKPCATMAGNGTARVQDANELTM